MTIKYKITTPEARVTVWNYNDRMAQPEGANDPDELSQIFDISADIMAIRTQKAKSDPSGSFEIHLAPTKNWVNLLTAGSWLTIDMTQSVDMEQATDQQKLKMLGRIDSVRVNVNVDENGTRSTGYIVNGRDWGSVFELTVYIDSLALNVGTSQIADSLLFLDTVMNMAGVSETANNQGKTAAIVDYLSTTNLVIGIKNFFGSVSSQNQAKFNNRPEFVVFPGQMFHIPTQICQIFNFTDANNEPTNVVADLIDVQAGTLIKYDVYNENQYGSSSPPESVGIPSVTSFLGPHNFWQLLVEHSNPILNEVISEMRWEDDKPILTLCKRVRPFITDPEFPQNNTKMNASAQPIVNGLISRFENIRCTEIALEDVSAINAGTNWRDKINFVEVMYDDSAIGEWGPILCNSLRLNSQEWDKEAVAREGFRPKIERSRWFPPAQLGTESVGAGNIPLSITHWKYILREWYFNTHNMLNGSVSLIGQDAYIGVGDNIMIPAAVLGPSMNFNAAEWLGREDAYLLVHVESVSHAFSVGSNGERHFATEISFVRGIFTDNKRVALVADIYKTSGNAIDKKATTLSNYANTTTNITLNITRP